MYLHAGYWHARPSSFFWAVPTHCLTICPHLIDFPGFGLGQVIGMEAGNSGHPINDGMKQRRKTVGGIQERSNGLWSSLPRKAAEVLHHWKPATLRNRLYPTTRDGKGSLFANISSSNSHDLERLRHTGLWACPDRSLLLPASSYHPLWVPLLQPFKSPFDCVRVLCPLCTQWKTIRPCVVSPCYPQLSECPWKPTVTFQTAVAPQSQGQRHWGCMAVVSHQTGCSHWPGACPKQTSRPAPSKTHLGFAPFSMKTLGTKTSQHLPTLSWVSNCCSLHRNLLHLLKGSLLGHMGSVFSLVWVSSFFGAAASIRQPSFPIVAKILLLSKSCG